jgi:rhodanese-related sulfurtransferase
MTSPILRASVQDIALARERQTPFVLLDVREPWEREVAKIDPAVFIPLAQLPGALTQLDPHTELVIYCHHGVRSLHACQFLASQGFTRLVNLEGGIDAWSLEVDPSVPRY